MYHRRQTPSVISLRNYWARKLQTIVWPRWNNAVVNAKLDFQKSLKQHQLRAPFGVGSSPESHNISRLFWSKSSDSCTTKIFCDLITQFHPKIRCGLFGWEASLLPGQEIPAQLLPTTHKKINQEGKQKGNFFEPGLQNRRQFRKDCVIYGRWKQFSFEASALTWA